MVGAPPFGFGVDDPAARRGCPQALGWRSDGLAAPLVPSGLALVQFRVPAVQRNLTVDGVAPLRLGVGEPVQVFAVDADRYRLLDQRLAILA